MKLKIKDDVDLKELDKFGFRAKYDEDTGRVRTYIYEEKKYSQNKVFPQKYLRIEFEFKKEKLELTYCELDFIYIIFDLIKADMVEKVEG